MELGLSIAFFIACFSAIFTIVNPFSTASVFLGITSGDSREKKMKMARKACIIASILLIVFAFAGNYILSFFSITIEAFKLAGGILVAKVGLGMLKEKVKHFKSKKHEKENIERGDISVIPLAIPMMSGPGALTVAIVLMNQAKGAFNVIALVAAIIAVCVIAYFLMREAKYIQKVLGETGQDIADKLIGLIILVVGIQFMINGIQGILTNWHIIV